MKYVLFSFDIEEFDLPKEYGHDISLKESVKVSSLGLEEISGILEETGIKATFFITGNFANTNPSAVRKIKNMGHEIACHGVDHFSPKPTDLAESKMIIEKISKTNVLGYRVPRMQDIDYDTLKRLGYKYDSSVNPAWIPGRYNHTNIPRKPYKKHGITEIPTSVATKMRIPLFWLALHLFPVKFYYKLAQSSLRDTGYLATYFHPWEFTNLPKTIPLYIRKNSGEKLVKRLTKLIRLLATDKETEFITYKDFLDKNTTSLNN